MFYLTHPLIIGTSFLLLVSAVAGGKDLVPVRRCKRVENPYVEEGTLSMFQKLSVFMSSLAFSSESAVL